MCLLDKILDLTRLSGKKSAANLNTKPIISVTDAVPSINLSPFEKFCLALDLMHDLGLDVETVRINSIQKWAKAGEDNIIKNAVVNSVVRDPEGFRKAGKKSRNATMWMCGVKIYPPKAISLYGGNAQNHGQLALGDVITPELLDTALSYFPERDKVRIEISATQLDTLMSQSHSKIMLHGKKHFYYRSGGEVVPISLVELQTYGDYPVEHEECRVTNGKLTVYICVTRE